MRALFLLVFVCVVFPMFGQNHIRSYGIFGGFNVPVTFDEGLNKDPRFRNKIIFRGTPVGFSYSYDYHSFGFIVTPSYTQIGQQYIISNIYNGDIGVRDIKMDYISVPIAFKLHIADFSFIRFNLVAAVGVSYLVDGKETLTFSASTLAYPESVLVPDKPGYVVKQDGGVATPDVDHELYVSRDKFNSIQVFVGFGAQFDIDISEKWGVNIDARANYGLFDPRTSAYKTALSKPTGVPDLNGERRDMYLSVSLGVVRIIQIEKRRHIKSPDNRPIKKEKHKHPKW